VPEHRSGTVTFVFTDIEGSTRLARALRDRWLEVRSDQRRLVRAAFAAHGGEEVDTQGDSFFYVFPRARDAAVAAAEAQRALAAHDWPEDGEVRIRIGMHTGEPVVSDEGYHGIGVHRAARIMAAGHGGQVLMSEATAAVLADDEVAGVAVRDLGRHQLKDLDRGEHVFQLVGEGLDQQFPRIRTAAVPRPVYRRPLVIGAAAGVLAAAVAIPVFALAGGSGGSSGLTRISDNAVGVVDAGSRKIVAEAPEVEAPNRVAAGDGAIWVTGAEGGGSVSRLDPESHEVRQTIRVGSGPTGIAVGAGAVWAANGLEGTVSRIDPGTDQVVDTTPVGNSPSAIVFGDGAVWVANRDDRTVSKLDPQSGDVVATVPVDAAAAGLAVDGRTLWITDSVGNSVVRLDTRTRSVLGRITVGSGPSAVAAGGGEVWVTNNLDGTISRIDARRGVVTGTFPVGVAPNGIVVDRDAVWVTDEVGGTLVRVNRKSGAASHTALSGRPEGVTVADGALWVGVQASGAAHRGGTLRILGGANDVDFVDPARAYSALSWQVLTVTSDGLVGFKRVGGAEGNSLVPDLATNVPTPTDGGRTYTFELRTGIRFSNGHELKPSDVRSTMERLFKAGTPRTDFWVVLVGGPECMKRPKVCDLSAGVVANDAAGTVTFHLREPDAEFLYKLALPFASIVPAGTPSTGNRPLPGTGPYRIAQYVVGRHVRLVRNPYFRTWSSASQPDGLVDEIEATLQGALAENPAQLRAVVGGRADFLTTFPNDRLDEVRTRYAGQLHITPVAQTNLLMLNTRRPPFDNVSARHALAYALDRARFVDAQGGSDLARPTCQVLPPNFPGYRAYCPYTLDPNQGGSWTAPDLARARSLIARSGTSGARVDVIGPAVGGTFTTFTNELVRTLRELGYRPSLRKLPTLDAFFRAYAKGAPRVEAVAYGWAEDYPAPSNFMDVISCQSNPYSCDPAFDAKARRALALQTGDPAAANEAWERLDREAVNHALAVPMTNPNAVDFVSKRLGNYQRHPVFGMLLDQVWVR
jgi:YVTN family beta-propeller protein